MGTRAVRTHRFEVGKIHGDAREVRNRWKELAVMCQVVTNAIWQVWLTEHIKAKSPAKIRKWHAALLKWHQADKATRGPKPKLDLKCMTPEIQKRIYAYLTAACPGLNLRPLVLLQNVVQQKMIQRKAANGNLAGWISILLSHESLPTSTRAQPIPFDKRNAQRPVPPLHNEPWLMKMRLDRVPRRGKTSTSHEDTFEIRFGSRNFSGREIVRKVAVGEYDYCGSSLQFDKRKNKWYVLLCYKIPVPDKMLADVERAAFVHAGKINALTLRLPGGGHRYPLGRAHFVTVLRRNILLRRFGRRADYKYASSARKGHGRGRCERDVKKLQARWKNAVRTINHTAAKRMVETCLLNDCGTLVFLRPTGQKRLDRFLATTGKLDGRRDSTSWDWCQLAGYLAQKCQVAGIRFVDGGSSDRKKQTEDKAA